MSQINRKIIHNKRESISGKKKRAGGQQFKIARLIYWLFLAAFFILIVYIFLFSGYLSLRDIKLEGIRSVKNDEIKSFITEKLAEEYLNIVPANNYFLISGGKIEKEINNRFKMIETAEVKKIFPDRLDISILERQLAFAFCRRNECFAIDEKGRLVAGLEEIIGQVDGMNPIYLYDESPNEIPMQGELFNGSEVEFIRNIGSSIEVETGISLEKSITTPSLISNEYRSKTSEGWEIYFNSNLGIEKEVDMLKVVIKEKISEEDRRKLEYVDLRTDNKVYYRLKPEEKNDNEEKQETELDREADKGEND